MQADFASYQQQLLGHLQQAYDGLQARIESIVVSQRFQDLVQVAMQQWLAAASCFAALMLLLATIAAGMPHVCGSL
jgi:hypothetical protein